MVTHRTYQRILSGLAFSPCLVVGAPQGTPPASSTAINGTKVFLDAVDNFPNLILNGSKTSPMGTPGEFKQQSIAGVTMKLAVDDTGKWKTLTCSDPSVADNANISPAQRWSNLDVDDAWNAAVAAASGAANNAAGLSWVELISNYFHGPDGLGCDVIAEHNGCTQDVLCEDPAKSSYVPMFLIVNSFVGLSSIHNNMYASMENARGSATNQIGSLSSTFAPIDEKVDVFKLILDLIGLSFALSVAPLWNAAFKTIPFFKANPNLLGTIKDSVNPLVSQGITLIKDGSTTGQSLNAQNTLSSNLGSFVDVFEHTLDAINKDIMSGQGDNVTQLHDLFKDGKMVGATRAIDVPEFGSLLAKSLYAYLIPQAWALSNDDIHPVIIDTGTDCSDPDTPDSKYIDSGNIGPTQACVGGKFYHVLSVSGSGQQAGTSQFGPQLPQFSALEVPPGLKSLTGSPQAWGGLTVQDLAAAGVATYKAAGSKNGGPPIDITQSSAVDDIIDNGVQAAGIVNIPVCGWDEAWKNWNGGGSHTPHWPCN